MRSHARFNRRLAKKYDDWMVAMHYQPHTQATYRRIIRLFIDFLGNRSITGVTQLEIREYIVHVSRQGRTLGTTYSYLTVLRVFYDFLSLGGVVAYAAPRLIRLRSPQKKGRRVLSEAEVKRLIEATQTLRERGFVEFLYGTGCRLCEATHLRVEDLNLDEATARVMGKGGKPRVILLTKTCAEALRTYLGDRTDGFVFQQDRPVANGSLTNYKDYWIAHWTDYTGPGPRYPRNRKFLGRTDSVSPDTARQSFDDLLSKAVIIPPRPDCPLSNLAVQTFLRRVGERAGLRRVTPHMLRRSFASHLYDHGASIEVIQRLLGHAFLQTTLLYTRHSTGRLTKTFERCHPRGRMHDPATQLRQTGAEVEN